MAAERERIAQDLHDAVGGLLTAVHILSGELADQLPPGEHADVAARVAAYATDALERVRAVSHGLTLPTDLAAALAAVASEADDVGGVRCTAAVDAGLDLPADVVRELTLLAREATGNALRHAQATTLTLCASRAGDRLFVEVTDDGAGGVQRRTGLGLDSMQARARRLGAELTIRSVPGAGTTVRVTLPLLPSDSSPS